MTPLIYLYSQCFIVALLSLFLHITLDANEMKKRSKMANLVWTFSMYLHEEALVLIASFLTILICLFFINSMLNLHKDLGNWLLFIFATVGYIGNSIATKLFGAMGKRIDQIIDQKTNQADGITK